MAHFFTFLHYSVPNLLNGSVTYQNNQYKHTLKQILMKDAGFEKVGARLHEVVAFHITLHSFIHGPGNSLDC